MEADALLHPAGAALPLQAVRTGDPNLSVIYRITDMYTNGQRDLEVARTHLNPVLSAAASEFNIILQL